MAEYCANHPDRETRVRCANCGKLICPECMVPTPVGIKCADCARPVKGQLRRGKPSQYVGAVGTGLAAALAGGLVAALLMSMIRFPIIMGLLLGAAVGGAVRRGAQGNRGGSFVAISAGAGFLGAIVTGAIIGPGFFTRLGGLLFLVICTAIAGLMLRE